MFSFHKPKVYRSTQGCCICKAKSSSSRFTDSKKYESDFKECFQLVEPRQGEICNACVLLVKRFKRLPLGHRRHWSHVVDARIGPGIKSMTKFKKRKEEQMQLKNASSHEFAVQSNTNAQNIHNNMVSERFGKIFKKNQKKKVMPLRTCDENSQHTTSSSSSDNDENRMSDDASDRLECDEDMSSIIGSPKRTILQRTQRKQANPIKNRNKTLFQQTHVIDLDLWKMEKCCCGTYFESKKYGAILVDTSQFSTDSCSVHAKNESSISATVYEKKDESIKSPAVIKSLPPKKQHFLRQIIDVAPVVETTEQSAPIDYSKPMFKPITTVPETRATNNLQKVRSDTGKMVKKIPKRNSNAVKNLVKLCTSTKLASTVAAAAAAAAAAANKQVNEHNENENITNMTKATEPIAVNKYSDNSSDSGYDETLHDTTQLNQIAKIATTRPIILSNGVKIHVKPENLLLAANLAGVSQTAIQSTQANMKALNAQKFPSNTPSYTCIPLTHDVNKKGVYVVTPNALAVTK